MTTPERLCAKDAVNKIEYNGGRLETGMMLLHESKDPSYQQSSKGLLDVNHFAVNLKSMGGGEIEEFTLAVFIKR